MSTNHSNDEGPSEELDTAQTQRCEICSAERSNVSPRPGRGVLRLCDRCDTWIARRLHTIEVSSPSKIPPEAKQTNTTNAQANSREVQWTEYAGIGYKRQRTLRQAGYKIVADLRDCTEADLLKVTGIGPKLARRIYMDQTAECLPTCKHPSHADTDASGFDEE